MAAEGGTDSSGKSGKDPAAFRTISELAQQLGVQQHVLRFWETRFPELKPLQRGGNRRYYRPADVAFAAALHQLLHKDGYTVKGVRKLITDHGAHNLVAIAQAGPRAPERVAPVSPPVAQPTAGASLAEPEQSPGRTDLHMLESLQSLRAQLALALAA